MFESFNEKTSRYKGEGAPETTSNYPVGYCSFYQDMKTSAVYYLTSCTYNNENSNYDLVWTQVADQSLFDEQYKGTIRFNDLMALYANTTERSKFKSGWMWTIEDAFKLEEGDTRFRTSGDEALSYPAGTNIMWTKISTLPGDVGKFDCMFAEIKWTGFTTYTVGGISTGEDLKDVPISTLLTWMLADYSKPKLSATTIAKLNNVTYSTGKTLQFGATYDRALQWTLDAQAINYTGPDITSMTFTSLASWGSATFDDSNHVAKTVQIKPDKLDGNYSVTYKGYIQNSGTDRKGEEYPKVEASVTFVAYAPLIFYQIMNTETPTSIQLGTAAGDLDIRTNENATYTGEYTINPTSDGYLYIYVPTFKKYSNAAKILYGGQEFVQIAPVEKEVTLLWNDGKAVNATDKGKSIVKYWVFRSKNPLNPGDAKLTLQA